MKNYFTILLLAIFTSVAVSCDDRNEEVIVEGDGDTYSVMKDITGTFNSGNNYTIAQDISIANTDVVLVYRNVSSNSTPVWQAIPKTYYLDDLGGVAGRELDYNFDFTTQDVQIYTQASFNQTAMTPAENSAYLVNQRFRIVLVPASQGKVANLDYSDYNAVIKYYNIPDRK